MQKFNICRKIKVTSIKSLQHVKSHYHLHITESNQMQKGKKCYTRKSANPFVSFNFFEASTSKKKKKKKKSKVTKHTSIHSRDKVYLDKCVSLLYLFSESVYINFRGRSRSLRDIESLAFALPPSVFFPPCLLGLLLFRTTRAQ